MKSKRRYFTVLSCLVLAAAGMLTMAPAPAKADIFEVNNPGSCSGGGSAGGGLCFFNGTTYVPYSLSGLLKGTYGTITIVSGTTQFVVIDDIAGGVFSYIYNSTTSANNATCQINGGTTAYFSASAIGCTVVDSAGNKNTGTLNATRAFNTGAQINNLMPPATITFDATGGFGKTFDLGFVSMQGVGTVVSPVPEPSSAALLASALLALAALYLRKG